MNWRGSPERVALPSGVDAHLWLVAVAFFGVGDLVTTTIGYSVAGVVELSPVVALLLEQRALVGLTILKTAVIAAFFAIWKYASWPYSLGIPLGLSILGVAVTLWNTGIILVAVTG